MFNCVCQGPIQNFKKFSNSLKWKFKILLDKKFKFISNINWDEIRL